jgi:mannose-6-phosphate isomerase-like protein (cupin superfamily)
MPTLAPGPHVFRMAEIARNARANSDLSRSARLVTPDTAGTRNVFAGVFWSDPGSTGGWSYRRDGSFDPALPFLGEIDELYYCLSGRIHVDWEEGDFDFGAGDIVFFPSGYSYRTRVVGDEQASCFYTMCPAPEYLWALRPEAVDSTGAAVGLS